jgi:hypothetical protein
MTTLQRLESPDPSIGGILFVFPSGLTKQITWKASRPIAPTLGAAKSYAARVLDSLLSDNQSDDAERTNWASLTAAVQRHLEDFNRAYETHASFRDTVPSIHGACGPH